MQVIAVRHASSPSESLRLIHGGIGGRDHFVGSSQAVPTHGDPNAGRHNPPIGPDVIWRSERLVEALGNTKCRLRRSHFVEEHDELISTYPSGGVSRPEHGAEARRHIDQELIAGGMAEGVIDELEVVDIEE